MFSLQRSWTSIKAFGEQIFFDAAGWPFLLIAQVFFSSRLAAVAAVAADNFLPFCGTLHWQKKRHLNFLFSFLYYPRHGSRQFLCFALLYSSLLALSLVRSSVPSPSDPKTSPTDRASVAAAATAAFVQSKGRCFFPRCSNSG